MPSRQTTRALWIMVLVLIAARAAIGYWLMPELGSASLRGRPDVNTRIAVLQIVEDPETSLELRPFVTHTALLVAAQYAQSDLLHSPLIVGTLGFALLLVGLFAMSRVIYPAHPGAALLLVVLVAFAPGPSWASYTTHPVLLGSGMCAVALAGLLCWHRKPTTMHALFFGVSSALCFTISFDSWVMLLPAWCVALSHWLRNPALRASKSSLVAFLLAAVPLAGTVAYSLAVPPVALDWWTTEFGPTPAPLAFSDAVSSLVWGMPVLVLAMPMTIVGNLSREPQSRPFPIARVLWTSLGLMILSVVLRGRDPSAGSRLMGPVLLLLPLAVTGTVAAILETSDRPGTKLAFVGSLALVSVIHGLWIGPERESPFEDVTAVGQLLQEVEAEGALSQEGAVLLEVEPRDPYSPPGQRQAATELECARIFLPARTHATHLFSRNASSVDPAGEIDEVYEHLQSLGAEMVITTSRRTQRYLTSKDYTEIGELGRYLVFTAPEKTELATASSRFVRTYSRSLEPSERR